MITEVIAALMSLRVYEQDINNPENFPIFPHQERSRGQVLPFASSNLKSHHVQTLTH